MYRTGFNTQIQPENHNKNLKEKYIVVKKNNF